MSVRAVLFALVLGLGAHVMALESRDAVETILEHEVRLPAHHQPLLKSTPLLAVLDVHEGKSVGLVNRTLIIRIVQKINWRT